MTEKISKYEVVERIAEGGFGVVYKARDPYLKRTVAVKTCTFSDTESRQRFFREAQLAARFDHPNVTRVHDFGVEDDQAFLVQEYLTGEDLLPKIQRGDRIPLHTKLEYLLQAARGLRYAHGRGVIHRDIKPGNIRVLESGEVKILDFGIAKPLGGSALTQQGMTVGTLGYLSPEQIEGKELDLRTDIFSFGVVAYELIAYTSPFSGKDVSGMLRSILGDSPRRLEELVPDCPEDVAEIVHRCLRRDRERRYDDFEALLRDLERSNRAIDPNLITGITAQEALPPVAQADTKPAEVTSEAAIVGERGEDSGKEVLSDIAASSAPSPNEPTVVLTSRTNSPGTAGADTEASSEPTTKTPTEPVQSEVEKPSASETTASTPAWAPPPPLEVPRSPTRSSLPAIEAVTSSESVRSSESPPVPAKARPAALRPTQSPPSTVRDASDPPDAPVVSDALDASDASSTSSGSKPTEPSQAPVPDQNTSGLPKYLLPAVGGSIAVLLLLGLGWFVFSRSDEPAPPVVTPVVVPVSTEPAPVVPITAPVLVVAGPWAEIAEILDAQGNSVESPAIGEITPKRIELTPGFYSIVLRHPEIPEVSVCQVNASPGVPATCHAEMVDVDVTGYFKETGWWN